ncbi:hypothetical protein [Mycobacteroides abscessus]|uniref:hypothetical protein n=1 Tax=Mycobacteroides abscessus TaxID=36809 RepID=UPI001F3F3991|nr:hypothetical protein [Mycobacteroides abscessus]
MPGVMPVLAGACAAGVLVAVLVGSWEAVAELTAVVMSVAAAGTLGRPIAGILGRPVGLICWRCSLD